jgi:hypothetical protein
MPVDLALEQPLGLQLALGLGIALSEVGFLGLLNRADQVPLVAVLHGKPGQNLVRRVLQIVPRLIEEQDVCHR